jgi:lysophospholipase L1-like esterase
VQIEDFFRKQIVHNRQVLQALGVKSLFVLQPIGYVAKPIHGREPFLRHNSEWWQAAYAVLDHEYESVSRHAGVSTLSLVQAFHNEERQIYLDSVHMNDLGNKIIGEILAQKVLELLRRD